MKCSHDRSDSCTATAAPGALRAAGRTPELAAEANPIAGAACAATIAFILDGRAHEAPAGSSLAELVAALGHAPIAVGTAVNGRFVARAERAGRVLQPGDVVLFFRPVVGG
jgi:sulfur carrier protein